MQVLLPDFRESGYSWLTVAGKAKPGIRRELQKIEVRDQDRDHVSVAQQLADHLADIERLVHRAAFQVIDKYDHPALGTAQPATLRLPYNPAKLCVYLIKSSLRCCRTRRVDKRA
jgi:hypothetical protein